MPNFQVTLNESLDIWKICLERDWKLYNNVQFNST